ncbi:ATP-dependent Clp endopeptidase, proteolytic subunit ClpP domain-containing protein [Toxoplasma gondii ME49]|uniref:ATP-dependent Clp protease proteolytic subunit n=3 Tax=Toxoplasma gondii TaxID=5811 RepID=S7UKI7_TOXGG|nr:ATP-dependent Clp endopeptidase, proteolytic subunit ClpP domain-containing protein [Toxoplasma gondii ME49]EPR58245.1 ATP-dependent Clp endopeptidase, proteolytic subunit ClpP domain-containing protein [Toxoplasma gondii GT1]EPT31443.1 ATP-dependent Clp endopeptidase, proteolytic subunit ClpP domain-containing protein [Toxoplasma gondii ME49]KAF4645007.1 ATP-dependent Clp endopeptidase, proteolytic subunit ClpP domain-containing protein [Toxoplasma gondii]|eukprot:XP_018637998.1 ATP-dependent Clp endopeptidase, proteolytic subunit ClpP domain-containing protein [Toxoplasma gondii ME49]
MQLLLSNTLSSSRSQLIPSHLCTSSELSPFFLRRFPALHFSCLARSFLVLSLLSSFAAASSPSLSPPSFLQPPSSALSSLSSPFSSFSSLSTTFSSSPSSSLNSHRLLKPSGWSGKRRYLSPSSQKEGRSLVKHSFFLRSEGFGELARRSDGLAMTDGESVGCMYTPGHVSPYTVSDGSSFPGREVSETLDRFFLRRRVLFLQGPLTDELASFLASQLLFLAAHAEDEKGGRDEGERKEDEEDDRGQDRNRAWRSDERVFCVSSQRDRRFASPHDRKRRRQMPFFSSLFPDSCTESECLTSRRQQESEQRQTTASCLPPVDLLINSPGGSVTAALSLLDLRHSLPFEVHTTSIGQAGGVAALLLAAGTPGHRRAFPSCRFSLRQIEGRVEGQAETIERETAEIESVQRLVYRHLAAFCTRRGPGDRGSERESHSERGEAGEDRERLAKREKEIQEDCENELFLSAEQGVEYGLIDQVIQPLRGRPH